MKAVLQLSNRKSPIMAMDPLLDKYEDNVLFTKKLEQANQMLKTAKLPPRKHRS